MEIPALILKQFYVLESLTNVDEGIRFGIKNPPVAAISSLDWVWSHEEYGRNR